MKKTEVLKALKTVSPGLDVRGIIEQSSSFVFTEKYVTTYNDEISISTPVDTDFTGAVPAKEFQAVINGWAADDIQAKIKNSELVLSGKGIKVGIPIESEIVLPLDFLGKKMKFKSLPDNFIPAISRCLFSTASENVSAIMNCVSVNKNHVISSDDFRITLFRLDSQIKIKKPILLPSKVARQLIKYKIVKYAQDGDWFHFKEKGSDTVFSCRALAGDYPELTEYLKVKGKSLELPKELEPALTSSKIFSQTDDSDLVTISMQKGKLKIKALNDRGWIERKMKIKSKAKAEFQVSPTVLLDIMKITTKGIIGEHAILFETGDFSHSICRISEED